MTKVIISKSFREVSLKSLFYKYTANVLTIKTMDFDHVPIPPKRLWTFHHSFNESGQNICSEDDDNNRQNNENIFFKEV